MTVKIKSAKTKMNFTRKEKKCHLRKDFLVESAGVFEMGSLKISPLNKSRI